MQSYQIPVEARLLMKDLEQFLKTNKYFQAGLDVIDGELTFQKIIKTS